jgi:ABC-2 type transport system ATP-binding protein
MADAVAEFEGVAKEYRLGLLGRRTVPAVAGVNLHLRPAEVFGLLGPNRAGKTTLVKLLLSLCRPTAGRVRRFGQPAHDRATLARVGYVHEHQAFPRYLTATGLLEFYGALSLVPYEEVRRRVPRLLERVGLADRSREPIAVFSKGMVQRLAIAQALVNEPDLLVLDEPNEGLDLTGRRLVADVVREQRQLGKTALLVSHVIAEVEAVCDRVGVLKGGRMIFTGPVAELTREPKTGAPRSLEAALQTLYQKSSP